MEKSLVENQHQPGSTVFLDEWVGPEMVDGNGYLRSGKILEWMDVVGVVVSSRYSRSPVVTASIDGLVMNRPIKLGSRITLSAKVCYTSKKSIGVNISMNHIESNDSTRLMNTVKAYMVFVALSEENHSPKQIPLFVPGSAEEQELFQEGQLRHEFRKRNLTQNCSTQSIIEESSEGGSPFQIKEFLKLLPSKIKNPWEAKDKNLETRSRHHSYIHKIEPVFSGQLNFTGTLYGGTLVNWVETSAHLSASAYLDGMEVTMSGLHGLSFLNPVKENVFLHIRSNVVHRTKENITVLTSVQSENPVLNKTQDTLYSSNDYSIYSLCGLTKYFSPVACFA